MTDNIIYIPASKSISNRLLILQYLYPQIEIKNLSTAKDTIVLQSALKQLKTNNQPIIDVGHAGTAMRFLTALAGIQSGKKTTLKGSERMHQRPIKLLVNVLRQLGVTIDYSQNEGFPPLIVQGKSITKKKINIPAHISSQYITALMLIAPALPNGLSIELIGEKVSTPYIEMTARLMNDLGFQVIYRDKIIDIKPQREINKQEVYIESDWSSASYFYEAMSILELHKLRLVYFDNNSLQGDSALVKLFEHFGVKTQFLSDHTIELYYDKNYEIPDKLSFDLLHQPDLAQTIAVTCLAKGIACKLTGLQTLRIKETDRLQALKNEMEKLGAQVVITDSSLEITEPVIKHKILTINTYDDHRMAMSFGVLTKKYRSLQIANPDVVVKSFPNYWKRISIL